MFELFSKTTSVQKIYAFIGSGVSVLLMNTMGLQHLLVMPVITTELGFFQKAVGLFLLAMTAGYIMRLYKDLYFKLSTYFLKSSWLVKLSVSCILLVTLSLPEFRKFQSLGLEQLSTFNIISLSAIDVIVKLLFTLLATTLGFFGGEFIPLIYAGTHLGHHLFSFLGIDTLLGAALGAYLLFAGATRFKWTSYVMLLALLGPSWWFWGYFVLSVAITFSGNLSLYKSEH
jgi:H+/Cl- antiporter ClcA